MAEYADLKDLLAMSRYAAYATVNADGSPHNSPLFFCVDRNLERVYVSSHPASLHAQNMVRTGKASAVIFGRTTEGGRGLYFAINNLHALESEEELRTALVTYNRSRARFNKKPLSVEFYMGASEQKLYVGTVVEVSSNDVERDASGLITRDTRHILDRKTLVVVEGRGA